MRRSAQHALKKIRQSRRPAAPPRRFRRPRKRLRRFKYLRSRAQAAATRALAKAAAEGFVGTDDAQLVERLGVPVHVVEGDPGNLKITGPESVDGNGAT